MADTNPAPQAPTEARVRELERRLAVVEPLLAAVAKEHADTRRQDNESMRALGRTPMPAKHCPCRICIAVRASALAGGTADPEAREGALRAILADNLIAEDDGFRCLWCDTFIQREHIDQPGSHLDERCPMRRLRAALAAGTPAPPPPEADRLREALAPFARLIEELPDDAADEKSLYAFGDQAVTIGDVRRAARALAPPTTREEE